MMNKLLMREIIDTWLADIKKKKIVKREEAEVLRKYFSYKQVVAISGVRRSGKTYLMFQLIQELLKEKPNNVCYINFEDERFGDEASQLDLLYRTFLEDKNPDGKTYFFLDEIQNIRRWEKWLARMYEKEIKFFISGSNASLLSNDFSKSLTGRHKLVTVFPLSFSQFVSFKNKKALTDSFYATENMARLKNLLARYLRYGGFPEVVYEKRKDLLGDFFRDILTKDILLRQNVRFKQSLREIALILLANVGRYHSLYSLNKIVKARSINTIKNYLSFLEDAYLIFKVPFFTFSVRKQLSNPFKIYAIDNGLRNAVSFQFSQNIGWLYENVVALMLIRSFGRENIFYWKDAKRREVDFVVKKGLEIEQLIQVCYQMEEKVKKRELKGLLSASRSLKCNHLLIITDDFEGSERFKNKKVRYIPLWRWLLS